MCVISKIIDLVISITPSEEERIRRRDAIDIVLNAVDQTHKDYFAINYDPLRGDKESYESLIQVQQENKKYFNSFQYDYLKTYINALNNYKTKYKNIRDAEPGSPRLDTLYKEFENSKKEWDYSYELTQNVFSHKNPLLKIKEDRRIKRKNIDMHNKFIN